MWCADQNRAENGASKSRPGKKKGEKRAGNGGREEEEKRKTNPEEEITKPRTAGERWRMFQDCNIEHTRHVYKGAVQEEVERGSGSYDGEKVGRSADVRDPC